MTVTTGDNDGNNNFKVVYGDSSDNDKWRLYDPDSALVANNDSAVIWLQQAKTVMMTMINQSINPASAPVATAMMMISGFGPGGNKQWRDVYLTDPSDKDSIRLSENQNSERCISILFDLGGKGGGKQMRGTSVVATVRATADDLVEI